MQRRLLAMTAGVTLLVLAGAVGRLQAQAKPSVPIPTPVSVAAGRWQVVNGAPEFRNMVMLLDTATGDTWIECQDAQEAQGWCRMFRSAAATGKKEEK